MTKHKFIAAEKDICIIYVNTLPQAYIMRSKPVCY